MSAKPGTPITRKEMYLDVMTGGSSSLPEPITLEEMYLAKIAGMAVDLPTPILIKHKYLAKIAGMTVNVPTYTTNLPRIYAYLAKAAGQDFEVPQPITREEMYWFDYVNGQPTPSEQEYTGAVPVTFIADGTPLLDYIINGNTAQSGTPTPDNPIMPQGTGERTGNLFDESNFTLVQVTSTAYRYGTSLGVLPQGEYTFNATKSSGAQSIFLTAKLNGVYSQTTISTVPFTFTADGDSEYIIRTANNTGTTWEAEKYSDMILNLGSTALPYEPYGIKIPISSANTTTPVYLGEVQTTRKVKKYEFTGRENIALYGASITRVGFYFNRSDAILNGRTTGICSHFKPQATPSGSTIDGVTFGANDNNLYFTFSADSVSTYNLTGITSIKAYLTAQYAAGTPVTVWCVLATPETAVVNEPLMKIGDYVDTVSMEQAGAQIPTVNGSNTLDVLTTVKPSEVYIKYKGEPVAGSQTSLQSSAYAPAEVSSQSESIDDINSSLLGKDEET